MNKLSFEKTNGKLNQLVKEVREDVDILKNDYIEHIKDFHQSLERERINPLNNKVQIAKINTVKNKTEGSRFPLSIQTKITTERSTSSSRIQELQKLNNDLMNELRNTSRRLMEYRIKDDKKKSRIKSTHLKQNDSLYENSYQEKNESMESKELKAKLNILRKELEKTDKIQTNTISSIKAECIKQNNEYFKEITKVSDCLNNFIHVMKKVQLQILNNDPNTNQLHSEFEEEKNNLMLLYKDLKCSKADIKF